MLLVMYLAVRVGVHEQVGVAGVCSIATERVKCIGGGSMILGGSICVDGEVPHPSARQLDVVPGGC